MSVETLQPNQEQEKSPEFKNLDEFTEWLQDETFRFGERSIYVDNKYDPSLEKHTKTLRKMGLQPGLNIQEGNEVASTLKANGVEIGIQDTVTLHNESSYYRGHEELASFDERTAWIRLADEVGGVYEVLFDGYLKGGYYSEGKLLNIYPNKWSDYASFSKGGISYVTEQGTDLEHKSVVEIPFSYNKDKTKHALELANGLRAALDAKLRILIPDFETSDLSTLPSITERSDALR